MILKDSEYRKIRRVARSRHVSIAEWVRQALELARRREPLSGARLEIIRLTAQHQYPIGDIDVMIPEIEAGYIGGSSS